MQWKPVFWHLTKVDSANQQVASDQYGFYWRCRARKTIHIAFLARNKEIFNAKDHWKVQRFEIICLQN